MSFVGEFTEYGATRSDAPKDWHIFGALAALSVALGTSAYTDGRSRPIYPNLWGVNIGPSGFGKSVALDLAALVVRRAGLQEHLLPDTFSIEALYDVFRKQPTRLAIFQEFGAFMDLIGREYNAGAQKWLTAIYDVPEEDRRELRKDTIVIRQPFLSILGASTPEWFADSFKADMLRGGFLARFLFCPAEARGDYVEHPGPHNEGVLDGLADHLRIAQDAARGRADWTLVQRKFNEWDRAHRATLSQVDPQLQGIASRAGVMVQKATMLFHASSDPYTQQMQTRDLDNAIAFVERSHRLAFEYLTTRVAVNQDDKLRMRILEIIRARGGLQVPRKIVLRNAHADAQVFDRAVRTLKETDLVCEQQVKLDGSPRASITYSLTEGGISFRAN